MTPGFKDDGTIIDPTAKDTTTDGTSRSNEGTKQDSTKVPLSGVVDVVPDDKKPEPGPTGIDDRASRKAVSISKKNEFTNTYLKMNSEDALNTFNRLKAMERLGLSKQEKYEVEEFLSTFRQLSAVADTIKRGWIDEQAADDLADALINTDSERPERSAKYYLSLLNPRGSRWVKTQLTPNTVCNLVSVQSIIHFTEGKPAQLPTISLLLEAARLAGVELDGEIYDDDISAISSYIGSETRYSDNGKEYQAYILLNNRPTEDDEAEYRNDSGRRDYGSDAFDWD
ncbi:MAG: hypothetical protein LBC95_00140 [Candidatus Nomurabacteria bacterium]|jgi:hypothetical protein|nr:hypothetical protein [Candidatus Nomurabacteria bacterium]